MSNQIIEVNHQKIYFEYQYSDKHRASLVFLHDSLVSTELWRDFPQKLSQALQCNVLVYDRIGYGKSDAMKTHIRSQNYMELEADILNEILSQLNVQKPILFGHSDGGTIALITAAKYPKSIEAVICEAGHIFVEEVTLKGVTDALHAYQTTNLPQRLSKYHGNKVEMLFKAWTEIWLKDDFKSWNIEYLLPKITCPLLFIQGEDDEYGTLDQVDKTISKVSGNKDKFIIPNVGHTPHKEVPELVLEKTISFVTSLSTD
ncbi:alpha/beta fold hydrolase [Chryseobacterium sp.]|uniref:alpha/beta fold hydrolase n=1 Tax=Chryseobacterium sp. TaxID=1871047 RepID=UPI00388DBD91